LKKDVVRKKLLGERKLVTGPSTKSRSIFEHLTSSSIWLNSKRVCGFVSIGSEVKTVEILEHALQESKELYLPWVGDDGLLSVSRVLSLADLEKGAFGILEPKKSYGGKGRESFPITDLDLILVPGLGFDGSGRRLGYGKGFYDRFLLNKGASTITVGLAFSSQIIPKIPVDEHDQALAYLVCEDGLLKCPTPGS